MNEPTVWVFSGASETRKTVFPSGVFSSQENAERWIEKHALSGTRTMYRVDVPALDWAIENGHFRPSKPHHATPDFIAHFAGGDVHFHYKCGKRTN